ncbi:NAD(P)-binding protein [Neoconidiobolus thromboides FSU 785]|nr:NAD(P)-binding protein [Neoconidiobolus thromboides FSU 785]
MENSSLFDVKNKVVVITGGGKGVGEHIAEGFVTNGAKVYITGRKQQDLHNTCERLNKLGPGSCYFIQGDMSKEDDMTKMVDTLLQKEKKIHVLINNAGATWGSDLEEITTKSYHRVMDLNVKALLFFTLALLSPLEEASTPEDPARVINIGSIQGIQPGRNSLVYDVSKAAVHHLSSVLAYHVASRPVLVNAIALGFYETKMTKGSTEQVGLDLVTSKIPLKRAGKPIEIAGTCIFLASKASGFITGATINVDGGIHIGGPMM